MPVLFLVNIICFWKNNFNSLLFVLLWLTCTGQSRPEAWQLLPVLGLQFESMGRKKCTAWIEFCERRGLFKIRLLYLQKICKINFVKYKILIEKIFLHCMLKFSQGKCKFSMMFIMKSILIIQDMDSNIGNTGIRITLFLGRYTKYFSLKEKKLIKISFYEL